VFDHTTFVPDGISPDDITSISVEQLNPCAAAACTPDETAAGKDNLPDIVILTKTDEPSYTILSDPNNPGTLQPPTAIGSEEFDDRDVEVADINGDGVPDMVVVSFDAPNRVYYGDPTRPGDYSSTMHDTFGSASDGSIGVEVFDLDTSDLTAPDIIVANENTFDKLLLGSGGGLSTGVGTGVFDDRYYEYNIPSSDSGTTTDVAVQKGLGEDEFTSFIAVLSNGDSSDQIFELDGTTKVSLMTSLFSGTAATVLTASDIFELDTNYPTANTQSVEVYDVTADGIPDVVVVLKDSPDGVAGYVYPGVANTPFSNDVFAGSKIPIGSAAVSGVEMTLVDTDGDGLRESIEILDENGGVHRFPHVGGTWPSAIYPDPNLPEGATVAATKPHDHQDANGVTEVADFDGDGFADVISGSQLLLSSLAVTKGDFSDVAPINFDHGAAPLAITALDADGDSDQDLFVIPGPSGNTGDQSTGGEAPYIILNRGDGDLKHSEKAILTGPPPSGAWSDISIDTVTTYTDSTGKQNVILGFDDASTDLIVISPNTASGPDGTYTKADWETGTVTPISGTAAKQTKQIQVVDLDGDGVNELLHLHDTGLDIMKTSDNGATWTIEKTIAISGATSFDVGHLDTSGTNGVRRGLDIVVTANDNVYTYYAPDFPVATGDPAPALADWGTASATITQFHHASSTLEKLILFDEDQNGIDDILVTTDTGGRYLYHVTETAAEQRHLFLSQNNPSDLKLSDETDTIISIMKVDANNDGAIDLIYAYEDGRTNLILSEVAVRTDLASLADPTTGIVGQLASEMNPTVAPPSELFCRENPGDATCVASADGAWIDTSSNVGGDVSQWGNGNVLTDPSKQTVTVGSPVDPATLPEHGPPCALPGSDVVPVQTEFYIEFPVVPCYDPGPHCVTFSENPTQSAPLYLCRPPHTL
jgi:hypothetical protein